MIIQSKLHALTAFELDELARHIPAKYLPVGSKMILLSSARRRSCGTNHTWYIVLLFSKPDKPLVIWGDDNRRTFDELFSII